MKYGSSQLISRLVTAWMLAIVVIVTTACGGMTVTFPDEGVALPAGSEPAALPRASEIDIDATIDARLATLQAEAPKQDSSTGNVANTGNDAPAPDLAATEASMRATIEAENRAGANVATNATNPGPSFPFGVVTASNSVNVRGGPDTAYPILRAYVRGTELEVVGRSIDREWWQVRVPDVRGGVGWVSNIYLQTENTENVPVVQAPPLPPPATPSPTNTPLPPTATPTPTPAPSVVQPPPSGGSGNPAPASVSLNISGSPRYGEHSLVADGSRQTYDIAMSAGGNIDAGADPSLPGSCSGFVASTSPDARIYWDGGNLVIYFRSGGGGLGLTGSQIVDTTLLVNRADGSWVCNDDGWVDLQPLVDLSNAPIGTYDIYVGTYNGGSTNGTLHLGEFRP